MISSFQIVRVRNLGKGYVCVCYRVVWVEGPIDGPGSGRAKKLTATIDLPDNVDIEQELAARLRSAEWIE
ncbi:hypothetical protein CCR79_02245 [Halorhodospira halophila]|nr:hypothetical protein [Halorhodospira halophila]